MEEFRCECPQTQPGVAILTTATKWDTFRGIFGIGKNEEIHVAWQNKGWAKVKTTEDWDKIREQVVEQPSPEDNGNFPRRLVMEIRGRMGAGGDDC